MRTVDKPWGREIWWAVTDKYAAKILEVHAGHGLSLQYHQRKMESMLFRRGSGVLVLDHETLPIREGLAVTIKPGQIHRIVADSDLEIIEVSTPELDDVVRLEDDYGRAGGVPSPATAARLFRPENQPLTKEEQLHEQPRK